MVDDFDKAHLPPELRPGPSAALTRSEMLTLAIFSQWQGFGSARGFYRHARRHLRGAFPAGAAGTGAVQPPAPPPLRRPGRLPAAPGPPPARPGRALRGAGLHGRADP
jgi:hypothetical protein